MEVIQHLCKLLQQRDKIAIPGFGMIQTKYAPATIHPTQHLFQPPHKSLSFDKLITKDDGLLIHFIAHQENISMQHAADRVHGFVKHVEEQLKSAGQYLMEGIGKFYFDIEKQLRFLPDNTNNFLLSSYGLGDFISQPILRPENVRGYASKTVQVKKRRKFIWFQF